MYSRENIRTLGTILQIKAEKNKSRTAVLFEDRKVTYADLSLCSGQIASALNDFGIRKHQKVAVMLFNGPEFLYAWFGINRLGAVMVSLNTALKGEILKYELEDSDACSIFIDSRLLDSYMKISSEVHLDHIFIFDKSRTYEHVDADHRFHNFLKGEEWNGGEEIRPPDPASILYTSGTTGPPKGVVLPHFNYISSGLEFSNICGVKEGDVLFTALPLFHCNAQHMTTMAALLQDQKAAYAEWFSASEFWRQAKDYGATIANMLIAMVNILFKQPERPDDRQHHVRIAATAGTSLEIWRPFEERFRVKVVELYGLTETGCCTIANNHEDVKPGSIGRPLNFVEAKIVDEEDVAVSPHIKGEIVLRPKVSFSMMLDYYGKADKTVEAWRNLWFHTGDYGYYDEHGYFYFVERKKDIIRRRGENVAPYDIERIVNTHPSVFESVAVGVPSEVGEEDVKLFVKLKPSESLDPIILMEWCDERLPFFMVPRYIEYVDEIPKTANQKAQRYLLKGRQKSESFDREKAGFKLKKRL